MTRTRVWFLTALVALALAINIDRLSLRVAQSEEDAVHGRLAAASAALRAQIDLRDARLAPRLAASSPDLIDALRPPADPTLPVPKPDDRALRAAAAALQPVEPDLLIVATADGAVYSRRGKPAALVDEVKDLPLVKATLEGGSGAPVFVQFDGGLFRVQAARIPGSVGVVSVGMLIDDRLATQLASASDASVSFVREGNVVASSLADASRAELISWTRAPELGYGTIALHLPLLGGALDGSLPRGAPHYAVRAARAPLESGVMAVLTLSANPYFGWLGRYESFYLIGCIIFLIFGFVWGLLPGGDSRRAASSAAMRDSNAAISSRVAEAASRAAATLAGANDPAPKPTLPQELPWTEGDAGWGNLGKSTRSATGPRRETLDLSPPRAAAPEAEKQAEKVEGAKASAPTAPGESEAASSALPPPPPPAESSGASAAAAAAPASSAAEARSAETVHSPAAASTDSSGKPSAAPAAESALHLVAPASTSAEATAQSLGDGWDANDPFAPQGARPSDAPASPAPSAAAATPAPAAPSEFSFGSLLNETSPEPAVVPSNRPELLGHDDPEFTRPNAPSPALLAKARGEEHGESTVFPGDEPTRIEAVSAALLDKMRERDAEPEPQADWAAPAATPAHAVEAPPPHVASAPAFSEPPSVQQSEPPPTAEAGPSGIPPLTDADEAHFEETYRRFVELRVETGEPADKVSYEKFAAKLRRNREELLTKHSARGVRFSVYLKDGRAAIKASAIR